MEDKFSNAIIILMIMIIFVLGGIYYAKIAQSQTIASTDIPEYGEKIEDSLSDGTNDNQNYNVNDLTVSNLQSSSDVYKEATSKYQYNNKYYYNRLNDYSKKIYDAIVDNIDNLKSGTSKIEIKDDFSELLSSKNGQELLKQYYDDAVNALNLDIPHLFYVDFSKMWLNIETTSSMFSTKYRLFIDSGNYASYYTDDFVTESQVALAMKQIEKNKDQLKAEATGNTYYTIKRIHDKLINDMTYDGSGIQKATVYGALIERKGVCESYARTFKYVLDELGIENILVTGKGTNSNGETEDHMWNYVKLNNRWYAVDVTWDDPIVLGGGTQTEAMKHKYFLKGSNEFFQNHTESLTISSSGKVFELPTLSTTNY